MENSNKKYFVNDEISRLTKILQSVSFISWPLSVPCTLYNTCIVQPVLLYLPTQMRLQIGQERVTSCHVSKQSNSLGWTKLTNSLVGKQQLELWTPTWSGHAPWNRGKFVCQSCQANNFFAVLAATKRFQFFLELGGTRGTLRVSGKQNSLFPLVIKCLISGLIFFIRLSLKFFKGFSI